MNKSLIEKLKERSENMRKNPTIHERIFKKKLEENNIRFKTQFIIGIYIVDFIIGNTIVEIDGSCHDTVSQQAWDQRRDSYLRSKGYLIIRIRNKDVSKCKVSKLFKNFKVVVPVTPEKFNPTNNMLKRIERSEKILKRINHKEQVMNEKFTGAKRRRMKGKSLAAWQQ